MGGETNLNTMSSSSSYPKLAERPVGKKIENIYYDRLRQFTSTGQYQDQNLFGKLYEGRATGDKWVKLEVYSPPDLSRPLFKEATSHKFHSTSVGRSFGPSWATHWFKITLTIPDDLRDKDHLEFHWDTGSEGMIWTEDGDVVHGLTGGDRTEWILPDKWRNGKPHVFYIEMACNHMFGNAFGDTIQPPPKDRYYTLSKADIVAVNLDVRALHIDFWIIGDAAREFPRDSYESHQAFDICNRIMDHFIAEAGTKKSIRECRKIAQEYLGKYVDSSKVYDSGKDEVVTGIGHCHIDTCWLWPWAETKRKVARSWSTQCNLMDRYPEFRFCASSAQQYKWLKQYYPGVFDRVKSKVKEGKFHPIGGSWVEHDTNMPSGESLVRQFVYGQRFFERHFGQRCNTFWLPDTFGYSAQLPQLTRLAGMTRFFTQKLSWNNINNFPHTTFNWVALDGTQVLCHMTPAETYTAEAHFGDVKRSITQHKSLDQGPESLLVYGKGDGGGGPLFQHIEKLRRCRAISDTVGLLPRVKLGDSVDDFFAKLEKKVENGTQYVTWYGELYFELHRGTYTTQANNKRNNRRAEFLLRDLEFLCTLASIKDLVEGSKSSYKYPKKKIDFMWEGVLLCHFHDCLPGSSIEMCYDDSDELYAEIFKVGEGVIVEALEALGFDDNDKTSDLFAVNLLPWKRSEVLQLDTTDDSPKYGYAQGNNGMLELHNVPSMEQFQSASISEVSNNVFQLENTRFRMVVENGVITSLVDRWGGAGGREVIAKGGKANQLVIFDDKPLYWQAWDVEVYHMDSRKELHASSSKIGERGPHRVSVVTETKISDKSWVRTTISLSANLNSAGHGSSHDESTTTGMSAADMVDISAEVEWHETMKFLKVEFPVDITNTEASYECQFGIVRRPTHYNTTWDMAKFEVCCHKWADLSEAGYGVSILNDSKYGFATCGNLMRLSLLRAPKAPDAHADMGRHHIRYAIFPHRGPLDERTVRAGYAINTPLRLHRHRMPSQAGSLLSAFRIEHADSLVLDTVKRGEDDEDVVRASEEGAQGACRLGKAGERSVVLRIYDALGGKTVGWVAWGDVPVKRVVRVNLLEDEIEEVEIGEKGCWVEVRAFEVVTLKLVL